MLVISTTTKDAVKQFTEKEWRGVDVEHYGKPIEWLEIEYVFKAVDDNKIVGIISGMFEAGVLYINDIIVAESVRGKGVGKALMEKAEEFGKKEGALKAHLSTGKGWQAQGFYESLGYQQIAVFPKHHFNVDFIIYEKFFA